MGDDEYMNIYMRKNINKYLKYNNNNFLEFNNISKYYIYNGY